MMRATTELAPAALQRFQDDFVRALAHAGDLPAEIAALAAQPGFAVHRNTVAKGRIDALQANHPAVARLVGEEWLRAAAAVYVRAHPPANPMLFDYGDGFAGFLAEFEPASGLPYLPGVAQLDRYWAEAHAAADASPLPADAFAGLGPGDLGSIVVGLHPSARWRWFDDQPIVTLWRRNRHDGTAPGEPEIEWRGEGVLVVRPFDAVESTDLDSGGCAFLDACAAGGCLLDAALAALEARPDTDLAQLMTTLLHAGVFVRMTRIDRKQGDLET